MVSDDQNSNELFIVAELTLKYKSKGNVIEYPKITSSRSAYSILLNNWSDQMEIVEDFNILLLNRNNRVLGMVNISKGGYSGTVVDPKIVFATALIAKASGIILSHNHPSGNLKPSNQDKAITKKLVEAGKLLDLQVLDHLILTTESYFSFADEGLL